MNRVVQFLLPLVLYIVLELLWGVWVAMGIAALFPIGKFIYTYIKTKKYDYTLLLDICAIVAFAVLEVLPHRLIVCFVLMGVLLVLSGLGVVDIFKVMGGKMFVNSSNPYMLYSIRQSQLRMSVWCFVGVVVWLIYESCWATEEYKSWVDSWWWVTLFTGYVALEIVSGWYKKYKYRNSEIVPLVNENGEVTGVCPRPLVHNGSMWLHPVVHLHVIHNNRVLLQLRPKTKKIQPGKWDTAVGGHIAAGEKLETSLQREVWEEIGLRNFDAKLIARYVWESSVEHEYVFSFITDSAGPFKTENVGEVDELRFWSKDEIENNLGKEIFTPNLENELKKYILSLLS